MKFLIDAQLPPVLAAWLRERGHDAKHAQDHGLREANDKDLASYAKALGAIIVTKDRDFVASPIAEQRCTVIWVRIGNVSTRTLLERFDANWAKVEEYLAEGNLVVELR